jgi:hypothetical protein
VGGPVGGQRPGARRDRGAAGNGGTVADGPGQAVP